MNRLAFISSRVLLFAVALLMSCTSPSGDPVGSSGDGSGSGSALQKSDAAQGNIPDRYIVVLNDDVSGVPGVASDMARAFGLTRGHVYQNSIKGFSATIPAGRLNALARDPRVKYVEPDKIVTLAPPPGKGPGGGGSEPPPAQTTPWGISRVNGGVSGAGKTAWIIDTGIDLDHPDLNVDVARSVDFTGSRKGAEDEHGHGTHVAGTIAAKDNSEGVIGVAAGASVVAVRVLDRRGSGSYSDVIAGVDYVGTNGSSGDVANMSLGGPVSQALDDAVVGAAQSSGVKFVLAAGNESDDANNHSPARANGANVFTVSAMDSNDNWAYFSNYGNPPIDFAAPGVSVYSCYKGGGYATMSGTSMAAPHVAGVLLLGAANTDGTVNGDPDGNPDPIAVH